MSATAPAFDGLRDDGVRLARLLVVPTALVVGAELDGLAAGFGLAELAAGVCFRNVEVDVVPLLSASVSDLVAEW